MNLWTGTSGFQYKEWKGGFYPEKLPLSGMLKYYAGHFASTEINYSFRQIPSEKSIAGWTAATPEGFRFSFKAPQRVTHFAKLRDCMDTVEALMTAVRPLGDKLGAVLFQLPPAFKADGPLLADFLDGLPADVRAAFEFRHESWFADSILSILRERRAALCIADAEDFTTPPQATAGFGYLRLRREDYKPADLRRWGKYIQEQADGWEDAYLYFKHEDTGTGPKFAKQLMEYLS